MHFGDSDFLARYRSYQQHLPEWRQQYPHLASVDMRYENQVVLDMAQQTTPSGSDAAAASTTPTPERSRRTRNIRRESRQRSPKAERARLMSQKSEDLLTVLDAGSSKIRVLVAELHEGALRYRAHSVVNAAGMRKGLISDLQPASRAFNQAATEAEQMAKAVIANCVVGLGGPHVRGVNSQGGISLGNRLREITREDVRAAVDRARSVSLPADREILHLLPQQFILDEQPGIHDPVGMVGNRLEVNLHIATCSASAAQSVVTCANKAGLEVTDTVFEGIAAAEATVSADERELGACLIDIGAGSTELVVFFEGAVAHTAVVPVGGDHFTNDLAVGLHMSVQEAEAIKLEYGHCVVTSVPSSSELELIAGWNAGDPHHQAALI